MTRNWNIVNDKLNASFYAGNEIIYNTVELKSNLSNYNDAHIIVRGKITIAGNIAVWLEFKRFVPFTKCIVKIDGKTVDGVEYLDLFMLMYNLSEYGSSYSATKGSLGIYYKDRVT